MKAEFIKVQALEFGRDERGPYVLLRVSQRYSAPEDHWVEVGQVVLQKGDLFTLQAQLGFSIEPFPEVEP